MRRLSLFTIFFLYCTGIGFSQNSEIDSLQSLLPQLINEQKVEVLNRLTLALWFEEPEKAKQYAKQAISLSIAVNNIRLQSTSYRLMGGVLIYQGEYERSLIYTRKALNLAVQADDPSLMAISLNNIGFNYYNLGNYTEAMENFLRALEMNSTTKKQYALGYMINNVGLVYLQIKKYRRAKAYFEQAWEVGRQQNDNNTLLYASNNLGFTYLQQGEYIVAEKHFKESAKIAKVVNNVNWEATAYSGLGQTHYELGNLDDAMQEFKKSLDLRSDIRDLKGISEIYHYLSKVALMRSKLDSSIYFVNISQSIAQKAGTKGQLLDNFKLYQEIYVQRQQYDSALLYQSRYVKLREEQFDENSARSIAGIQLEIKEEKTSRELIAKDIELTKKSFQLNFSVALAIFILLISVVLYWFYKTQQRQGRNLKIKNAQISQQRDEIIQKNEELKTLNMEKNDLISIVSHDLKSPLNNIRGLISVIKLPPLPPSNRAAEFIEMINESTLRLTEMIEKILNIEAIESKKLNLNPEFVSLSEIAQNCMKRFEGQAAQKQIKLHSSTTENIMICADKGYMEQVIDNLLSNAIKFSPSGKNVYLDVSEHNNTALCEVKDEGPGLTDKDKKKLFRKYQKLSNAPTGNESSSGLGLSIVKKYVKAMKGKIWCKSEEGNGASFFISFPKSGSIREANL